MNKIFENGRIFLGINYWASANAINMWDDWSAEAVEADFKILSEYGITHIRVFPLWPSFQPLYAAYTNHGPKEYCFKDGPLPDTEAGRAGVSEEACTHFAALCDLAVKYKLKVIVGLITGHMSFRYYAPPAFEGKNPINDPTVVKWQLRFIKYFVKRFAGHSAIAGWDLGNECCGFGSRDDFTQTDSAYVWCSAVGDAIRTSDPLHPVISGFDNVPVRDGAFNIMDIAETIDIHTVHPYNIFATKNDPLISMRPILDGAFKCRLYEDIGKVPTFIQEIGSIGYANCSERSEALFYRALVFSAWVYNCHGIMWWCAFDQGSMSYPPYDWNSIGSQYGFFREDMTSKPIAQENKRFSHVMAALPIKNLPSVKTDAVCIVPDNTENPFDILRATFCLGLQANMNIGFVHAAQPMPESDVYILPSLDAHHSISKRRLDEILSKVRSGAYLYISLGEALFRDIPSLTGMNISYRQGYTSEENVTFGDMILRLKADYKYTIESCDAEVLARGEDGRPVYVKHKYGEGYVYFSTIPVEKYLSVQNVVFNSDNCSNYSLWYKELSERVSKSHAADIKSQMARITEHIIDKNNRYAVVINYSHEPVSAELILKKGWSVAEVYYGNCENRVVYAQGCDAVVMKLEYDNID